MNSSRKIMVIGSGDLGCRVTFEMAHSHQGRTVQLLGRDEEKTLRATNLTRFSALQRGYSPTVSYAVSDLTDIDRTAECIAGFAPDVIFLAASYQSWWVITQLPERQFKNLYAANFGPWLPMHLVPVMNAMRAVRRSGSTATVVNAAYPDAVHPALDAIGLSPDIGIGNVANNIPGLRMAAADMLCVEPEEVEARLVAHHYVSHRLSRAGDAGVGSLGLSVLHQGKDVTDRLDIPGMLKRLPVTYRRTGGLAGQAMTAASALSVLEPLVDERDATVHAPGPHGLTGGYPLALESGRIRLNLPAGISEREAEMINVDGQRADGITRIDPDGTVTFEPDSMRVLTRELGYNCPQMRLTEAEDRAAELGERFAAYRRQAA